MIHKTAEVSSDAKIGKETKVWNFAQIREGAIIGEESIIGKNVYVDANVIVGNRVKIQNNVSLYRDLTIEDGVFIGPHVCFTNDKVPRAINEDGTAKKASDWETEKNNSKRRRFSRHKCNYSSRNYNWKIRNDWRR